MFDSLGGQWRSGCGGYGLGGATSSWPLLRADLDSYDPKHAGLAGRLKADVIKEREVVPKQYGNTRWCLVAPDGTEGDTDPDEMSGTKAMKGPRFHIGGTGAVNCKGHGDMPRLETLLGKGRCKVTSLLLGRCR